MQKNINRLEVAYLEKLLSSVEMKKPDGSLKGYGIKVDYSGIFSALRVNSAINLFSKKLNNSSNVNINKIVKSLAEYLRFYKIDYKKITIVEKNKDKDEKYFRIYEGHDDVETISLIEAKDLNQAKAKNTKHVRVSQFIRFSPKFMNKDIFFKHMALGVIGKNIVTSNEEQFNSSDNIIPTIYMDNSFWLDLSTLKNDVEQNINQNSNFGIVNLNANPSLKEEKIIEALEQTLKDASKVNSAFFGKNITMFSRYLKSNYRLLEFDLLFLEKKKLTKINIYILQKFIRAMIMKYTLLICVIMMKL